MNWDDPAERFRLIERVGPQRYNEMLKQHQRVSTIKVIGGHPIRPVTSRFGRLYMVGSTGRAFAWLDQAEAYAQEHPVELEGDAE